jgi:transcriptional antiterminator RfaH
MDSRLVVSTNDSIGEGRTLQDEAIIRSSDKGPRVLSPERDHERFWFCVQTHPKHEHIAAAGLAKVERLEVFNPQVRFQRATKRGPVWFTESAFSGYIFARFNLQTHLFTVRYSASVAKVVHFNSGYPSIPDQQMEQLRVIFGADGTLVLTTGLRAGDKVRIVGGAFHDLIAVVQQVLPAKQRARALLEFLGRMTTVELGLDSIVVEERYQPSGRVLTGVNGFARNELGRSL